MYCQKKTSDTCYKIYEATGLMISLLSRDESRRLTYSIMNTDYKHRISKHRDVLQSTIESRFGLVQSLVKHGVFSDKDGEEIKERTNVFTKNEKLLELLLAKTDKDKFIGFRESLAETRQRHIVNYIDLNGG